MINTLKINVFRLSCSVSDGKMCISIKHNKMMQQEEEYVSDFKSTEIS